MDRLCYQAGYGVLRSIAWGQVNVNPPENSDLQLLTVGSSEGEQYASVGVALLLHV